MVIELILVPVWLLIDLIINLFPAFSFGVYDFLISSKFIQLGLYFLPSGFWSVFLASVLFWMTANFGWGIVEWVYKKIPGIS